MINDSIHKLKPSLRIDMVQAIKQMQVKKEYYMKNESTMRELNYNIVKVMSKIEASLQDMVQAIRNRLLLSYCDLVFA